VTWASPDRTHEGNIFPRTCKPVLLYGLDLTRPSKTHMSKAWFPAGGTSGKWWGPVRRCRSLGVCGLERDPSTFLSFFLLPRR
jgi:hypothetical protein